MPLGTFTNTQVPKKYTVIVHSFIHSPYWAPTMLGIVLGTRYIVVNKTDKSLCPQGTYCLVEGEDKWIKYYIMLNVKGKKIKQGETWYREELKSYTGYSRKGSLKTKYLPNGPSWSSFSLVPGLFVCSIYLSVYYLLCFLVPGLF